MRRLGSDPPWRAPCTRVQEPPPAPAEFCRCRVPAMFSDIHRVRETGMQWCTFATLGRQILCKLVLTLARISCIAACNRYHFGACWQLGCTRMGLISATGHGLCATKASSSEKSMSCQKEISLGWRELWRDTSNLPQHEDIPRGGRPRCMPQTNLRVPRRSRPQSAGLGLLVNMGSGAHHAVYPRPPRHPPMRPRRYRLPIA